jgi:tetratricopeptide (TPR) repeat protein
VGRGAFEAPAAGYRASDEGVRLVYPENLPLQIVTEWGIPAFLALLAWFAICVVRLVRRAGRLEPAVVGAACGVLAVLLHDLADFGLEMPGVALPTVVALGVVIARVPSSRAASQTPVRASRRLPVPVVAVGVAIWAAALVAGTWASGRTLTEDGARAREAVLQKSASARAIIDPARARHPADYYLELLAAIQAMAERAPSVMHHLNRALRLNPGSGETHAVAARWLARLGRRDQAALEFRLARAHGVTTNFDEIFAAVGVAAVDAVPQEPAVLVPLSQHLSALGHVDAADIAARRAAERADNPDDALVNVVDIAMATGDPARMVRAADYVLAAGAGPGATAAAVKALFRAGEKDRAVEAMDAALARLPEDASLLLAAARLRLQFGDPAGARATLTRSAAAESFHLADLVSLHELLAQIADQMKDADAAVIARARARMFARRVSESQPALGLPEGARPLR